MLESKPIRADLIRRPMIQRVGAQGIRKTPEGSGGNRRAKQTGQIDHKS
jgi:hypothetical protein